MEFKDKIAIVTGGTEALGRVIVKKIVEAGMKVYLPVQSIEHFKTVFDNSGEKEEGFSLRKIYALPCNASNEFEAKGFVEDTIKLAGRVDYLINTIGGYHPKRMVADTDSELLNKQLKLNFFSTFYFTHASLKNMVVNNYGRIVSIGAKPAMETTAGKFAYSFTKSGVVNLMQTIAEELKEYNITTAAIIPSVIDTPANRESMQNQDFTKWVTPEEIAETIMFLLSDSAKGLRGNVIKMYGRV
jgi:NAD(P)-dependent dehydrogenase (short-subunit alcohol dehydrogenase family)